MKRAIIVHCWSGSPEYCWYPWVKKELEVNGFSVEVPDIPERDEPKLSNWLPTLESVIGIPDEDTYLIGHSVGCITIMRYLENLKPGQKVGGVVMVAGFTDNLGFEELQNFFTTEISFEKIKERANHFVAIHSDDDPFVPLKHGDILKEKLDAELLVMHAMKHFSGPVDKEDSCLQLPEVVESVLKMSK